MLKQVEFTIFLNFGMELMSSDNLELKIQFTDVFKRQVRDLAKRYRRIKLDIQPVLDQLQSGDLVGDQIQNTGYTVFKVRIKNSDIQKGKSGGYRLIYCDSIRCSLLRIRGYIGGRHPNVIRYKQQVFCSLLDFCCIPICLLKNPPIEFDMSILKLSFFL